MATNTSMTEFIESQCVICCSDSADDGNLVVVKERGRQTIESSSITRNDCKLTAYLSSKPSVVRVHVNCRSNYNMERVCPQLKRKIDEEQGQRKLLRSSNDSSFDWKQDCFLCCKPAILDVRHPWESKKKIRLAMTASKLFETLTEVCSRRQDEWSFEVLGRMQTLQTCGDAVAAEARYHVICYGKFKDGEAQSVSRPVGGSLPNMEMMEIFQSVCKWMEENDDDLYTVVEVQEEMKKRAQDPEAVYGVQHVKKLLTARYGETIIFVRDGNRKDVLCFRNRASRIISDQWYAERESRILVKKVSALLRLQLSYCGRVYRRQVVTNSISTEFGLR